MTYSIKSNTKQSHQKPDDTDDRDIVAGGTVFEEVATKPEKLLNANNSLQSNKVCKISTGM